MKSFEIIRSVQFIKTYEIIRSVQGRFNQGNVALSGETADRQWSNNRQWANNALFSVCWSVVRDICN